MLSLTLSKGRCLLNVEHKNVLWRFITSALDSDSGTYSPWVWDRTQFLAHLSRRLTRWAYRMGLEPASVRPCVRASTLSNMNISETSRPITTKFYLKHHWGGGKAALGFGADQIRTLVSMAMDCSHKVIRGKGRHHVFSTVFDRRFCRTCAAILDAESDAEQGQVLAQRWAQKRTLTFYNLGFRLGLRNVLSLSLRSHSIFSSPEPKAHKVSL